MFIDNGDENDNKDLGIEIQIEDVALKVMIIPVVVGALGMIKKETEDHMKRILGNPFLQESQKIVLKDGSFTATCSINLTENFLLT